jgi:hypothetical protein
MGASPCNSNVFFIKELLPWETPSLAPRVEAVATHCVSPETFDHQKWECKNMIEIWVNTYENNIFSGMNIHKSQL